MSSLVYCDCNVKQSLGQATGKEIYKGVYREWKAFDVPESDTRDQRDKQVEEALGEYLPKYKECIDIVESTEKLQPESGFDGALRDQMAVTEVDHIIVHYELNGKEYAINLLGDNHIADYEDVPTEMEEFKLSRFGKYKMALSERRRLKGMALLAAYIYGCDGWDPSEIRVMKCLAAEIKRTPEKQQKLLNRFINTHATITEEDLLKKIKPVMRSKKGLTFAWHCMTTDHVISPQEEKLFEKLTGFFPGISLQEIETIKRRSQKFSRLSDEYLIKEYADISPEYSRLRKGAYRLIAFLLICILCSVGPVIYNKFFKSHYPPTEVEQFLNSGEGINVNTNVDADIDDAEIQSVEVVEEESLELVGNVGKASVDMELTLDFDSGQVWGSYSYPVTGSGTPIVLKGELTSVEGDSNKRTIELLIYEINEEGNYAGTFELSGTITPKHKTLAGQYISVNGKTYEVNMTGK